MEFLRIERKGDGRYLHRYDIHYREKDGTEKIYEMVSRDANLDSREALLTHPADAVVAVLTDQEDQHLLLLHEFRLEQGRAIYGLPGGLIEDGESPVECLARELAEETGLRLTEVTEIFPASPCCVGISNESAVCLFGHAAGQIRVTEQGDEEIEPRWFTREEIRDLHKTEKLGSWAMAFSWVWAHGCFPGAELKEGEHHACR